MTSTLYVFGQYLKHVESMTHNVHGIPLKIFNTRVTKFYAHFSERFIICEVSIFFSHMEFRQFQNKEK